MTALAAGSIHRERGPEGVADAVARFVVDRLRDAIGRRGEARLALAGGSTPRAAYERLAEPAVSAGVDWEKVRIFFGDERAVPPDDERSNYRMATVAWLSRVPLRPEHVHRIEGELGAQAAAERYAAALGDRPLDLLLLGMGEDGHVASLFPGSPALASRERVLATEAPVEPRARVTLGFSVIEEARAVALVITGAGKAVRVAEVFAERARGSPSLPAARVAPASGELHWFIDDSAGARIPG